MEKDIRWQQRLANYRKALQKFNQAIEVIEFNRTKTETKEEKLSIDEMLREGLIQRFEYTHELAWNTMKDYIEFQGVFESLRGSRDATREAFKMGLIGDGEVWMDMIQSRNETSHTYNEQTADKIYRKIIINYRPAFNEFESTMEKIRSSQQGDLFKQ